MVVWVKKPKQRNDTEVGWEGIQKSLSPPDRSEKKTISLLGYGEKEVMLWQEAEAGTPKAP